MTVAVRINTDDYGALFETCLGTEPVQTGFVFFFLLFMERSIDVMEFSTLTKRNTIPHFHPASRLKPSGRKFVHEREKRSRACKLCDAYRIVALYREPFDVFRFASISIYRLFYHESAKNTARSKGQKVKVNKTNTAVFWNVRTKSQLFTQLAD